LKSKLTVLLLALSFFYLNCLQEKSERPQKGIDRAVHVDFPVSCTESVRAKGSGATNTFTPKKGWRTNCGKEFEITHTDGSIDIFWEQVLFLRPNAVSEGFLPSLPDLAQKSTFEEYRKFGIFAESALESLFLREEVKKFLQNSLKMFQSCSLIVATASFGAQDTLHHPLNNKRRQGVCYVAFIDARTRKMYDMEICEESWYVLELPELLWSDPRMKTRMIRALLPFFFPHTTFSIWIDSKLQLQEDPIVLVYHHL